VCSKVILFYTLKDDTSQVYPGKKQGQGLSNRSQFTINEMINIDSGAIFNNQMYIITILPYRI
jgi:hypothetical protein